MSNFAYPTVRLPDVPEGIEKRSINLKKSIMYKFSLFKGFFSEDEGRLAAARCFGDPTSEYQDIKIPTIVQGYEDTCAIRCQQIIMRDYGCDISETQLKDFAESVGWYDHGTPMGATGNLLEYVGIGVHKQTDCTVYDLINELSQGHRVIVGVDSNELWVKENGTLMEKFTEYTEDFISGEKPDHALIVAGVNVDPIDNKVVSVVLTDPGSGNFRKEYSIDEFMDAWNDSKCFMMSTDTPAPYQYDVASGKMVPSNFAMATYYENNSFELSPDAYNLPDNYLSSTPYYADGHLDYIGSAADGTPVPYNDFKDSYEQIRMDAGLAPDKGIYGMYEKKMDSLFGLGEENLLTAGLDSEALPWEDGTELDLGSSLLPDDPFMPDGPDGGMFEMYGYQGQ